MKRKIYDKLLKWKKEENGHSAVLIEGARRVGKSYIAEEFAKNNYKTYILIDFYKATDEIKNLFTNYLDNLDYLFNYLSIYYKVTLYERESLIIFDEVQQCPSARGAIKYLVQDGRYDFIETGSLISIKKNVKDILIPSEEKKMKLYPMDFEEFLWAMNNESLMEYIRNCYKDKIPLGDALHRRAMDLFKEYLIVGGMPQAVKNYVENKKFNLVDNIKREILDLYRDDIRKQTEELSLKVEQIYDNIQAELQKHEKKFLFSDLNSNARYREYKSSFYWLEDAGLVNIAYNTTEPNIGLGQRRDDNSLKCYFLDTGLLLSKTFDENELINEDIYKKIMFNKLNFNEGMIMENVVSQLLVSSGKKLYFYSNNDRQDPNNRLEIDFLIVKSKITSRHNIIPIEVKSGKRYTYSSLEKFEKKYKDYIYKPIILHPQDLKEENGILYLPLYMTSLL